MSKIPDTIVITVITMTDHQNNPCLLIHMGKTATGWSAGKINQHRLKLLQSRLDLEENYSYLQSNLLSQKKWLLVVMVNLVLPWVESEVWLEI